MPFLIGSKVQSKDNKRKRMRTWVLTSSTHSSVCIDWISARSQQQRVERERGRRTQIRVKDKKRRRNITMTNNNKNIKKNGRRQRGGMIEKGFSVGFFFSLYHSRKFSDQEKKTERCVYIHMTRVGWEEAALGGVCLCVCVENQKKEVGRNMGSWYGW